MALTKVTNSMILGNPVSALDFGASESASATANATAFKAALASGKNVIFPKGTYNINDQLTIENQIVYSEGCYLNYTNTTANQACIVMNSNSQLLGTISIAMPDGAIGQDVNHLRVGGGDLPTDGAHNVHVGVVYVYGGQADMAAVLVEGNSYDVYIEEVNCPGTNNKIGQVFGTHWGNFQDHYLSGGVYVNVPGGAPTTHPRNVRLDRLIVGKLTNSDTLTNCAAFISSSRDIKIGYIYVEEAAYAVTVFPGDQGFEYADAATKVQKMYGIEIDTIIGKTRKNGVFVTGSCPYPAGNTVDNIVEFRSSYIDVTGSGTDAGLTTDRVIGISIDELRTSDYSNGAAIGLLSRNVVINKSLIQSCQNQAINVAGTLGFECYNIFFRSIYTSNVNIAGLANFYTGSAITLSRTINASMINGIVGSYSLDGQYAAVAIDTTCSDVLVQNIQTYGSASGYGFVYEGNIYDKVSFVNCACSSSMTLRYGTLNGLALDRRIVYGTSSPANGSWLVGDIMYNTNATSGGYVGWVCTSAGTPGTWKTFGLIS